VSRKRVKDTLGKIEAEHPDLEFSVITDQSLFINQSIGNLASSGIVGGFLAVAVLWIFLRSFRSLFVIGLSIPVSVIASFVLVYFSKLSLNLMTLGGLALGVGMLVDSSIVVLENIYRHFTSGMPILKAAESGSPGGCLRHYCLDHNNHRSLLARCVCPGYCGTALEGIWLNHFLFPHRFLSCGPHCYTNAGK